MLEFADKMLSDALPVIKTQEDVNNLIQASNETGNGIVFLFGNDDDDDSWKSTSKAIAQGVQHKTYCGILHPDADFQWKGLKSNGENVDISFPKGKFLASIEKGEVPRFAPTSSLTDKDEAEKWILSNNFPTYSLLASSNFRKLGKLGKLLVIAIVDPSNETTTGYLERFQNIARSVLAEKDTLRELKLDDGKTSTISISDHYVFGSLDGVHWSEFIEQFNIFGNELPRLVVVDMPKEGNE